MGPPDTIPYDQIPLARRVGEFLATPLVGYPVKYCVSEKEKNEYGETTDQSTPNCEGIPVGSARYVNFETDEKHKKPFEYMEKTGSFSGGFFQWRLVFFSRQSFSPGDDKPDQEALFSKTAHLVEFQKQSDYLAVVDSRQYGLDESG